MSEDTRSLVRWRLSLSNIGGSDATHLEFRHWIKPKSPLGDWSVLSSIMPTLGVDSIASAMKRDAETKLHPKEEEDAWGELSYATPWEHKGNLRGDDNWDIEITLTDAEYREMGFFQLEIGYEDPEGKHDVALTFSIPSDLSGISVLDYTDAPQLVRAALDSGSHPAYRYMPYQLSRISFW